MGTSSATVVKDNKGVIYIGGGWVSDALNLSSITTYNPFTDHWSVISSCPVQYGRLATVEKDKTELIMVGGILENDQKTTNKVFVWEGAGKWKEQYSHMSVPRLNPAVSVYNNKYVIVAGGSSRDCSLDSIEVLDIDRKEWSHSMVKLPYVMTEAVSSITGDDLIIMGNQSDEDITNSNECSILSIPVSAIINEAPVTITTLPSPPILHSTLIQNVNPPLLLGGHSNTDELPGVFVYCSELKNWKQVGTTTCNRANATSIVLHNNAILLLGGVHDGDHCSKETIIHSVEIGYI